MPKDMILEHLRNHIYEHHRSRLLVVEGKPGLTDVSSADFAHCVEEDCAVYSSQVRQAWIDDRMGPDIMWQNPETLVHPIDIFGSERPAPSRFRLVGLDTPKPRKLHLAVQFKNGENGYFPVSSARGWRINSASREIIVGKGVPRTHIPLDNVLYYDIEEC